MGIETDIRQSKFTSIHQKSLVNLLYTGEYLSSEINSTLKKFLLTSPQYNILRILKGAHPSHLTPSEIKSVMISKQSDLTRLIDRMKEKGIVDRMVCTKNRRNVNINITNSGLSLLEDINPAIDQICVSYIENKLTPEEAKTLSKLLDKIRS